MAGQPSGGDEFFLPQPKPTAQAPATAPPPAAAAAAPPTGGDEFFAPKAAPSPAAAPPPAPPSDQGGLLSFFTNPSRPSSYDPNWKPTGNYFHDLLTRPVAKTEDPVSAAQDYGLSTADAATLGLVGRVAPQAVGQARENLGGMDVAAQGLGYAMGPGKVLGPLAGRLTGLTGLGGQGAGLASRIGASAVSGGLEGAAAGGGGTAISGGDLSDIEKNAALGALGGAASGGTMPKAKVPDVGSPGTGTVAPTGMYAQKSAAYAPLDSIYFKGDHQDALTQAWQKLAAERDPLSQGVDLGVTPEMQTAINSVANKPVVTGRNLQQASRDLRDTGDPVGHRFADALDGTLANATPMPGSTFNGAPAQAGQAGAAEAAGDLWHGRIKDLERLGEDPGALTNATIKQIQQNYDPNSTIGQGLASLYGANQPRFNFYSARHVAAPLVGAAIGGAEGFFNPAQGQNTTLNVAKEAIEGGVIFGAGKALSKKSPSAALNEARYRIATGMPSPQAGVGNALGQLYLGNLAGSAGPTQSQ